MIERNQHIGFRIIGGNPTRDDPGDIGNERDPLN
jgi:hypothetical protein